MIPIYTNVQWNFTLVSILLNEMTTFVKKDHCIEELKGDKLSFNFQSAVDQSYQMSIVFNKNNVMDISVEVSYDWLKDKNEWISFEMSFDSKIGSRNRVIKKSTYFLVFMAFNSY